MKLNVAERRVAVERLHHRGLSAANIAEIAGLSARNVVRIRAELGLTQEGAA